MCGHEAKDITPLITWRREAWKVLNHLPWKDKYWSCFKGNVGETSETGQSAYGFSEHIDPSWIELSWAELLIVISVLRCVQIMWTSTVFKDPVPVILDMLTDALLSLDPSLSTCFATYLQQNSEILATLGQLKQVWFGFFLLYICASVLAPHAVFMKANVFKGPSFEMWHNTTHVHMHTCMCARAHTHTDTTHACTHEHPPPPTHTQHTQIHTHTHTQTHTFRDGYGRARGRDIRKPTHEESLSHLLLNWWKSAKLPFPAQAHLTEYDLSSCY